MNKLFRTFFLCMLAAAILTVSASALEDAIRVGLCFDESALPSASLENQRGSGYSLGWFEGDAFHTAGYLEEEKISITAAAGFYVQLEEAFTSFEDAANAAGQLPGGFPALVDGAYRVRLGGFPRQADARTAAGTAYVWRDASGGERRSEGRVAPSGGAGTVVAATGTDRVLFALDCGKSLGVLPDGQGEKARTWFQGTSWYGGFEFRHGGGGKLHVINVVNIDDYVKGVLPYEMSPSWPLEALKAQAVCARTYALWQTRHAASQHFDVCATTDCQVYRGTNAASELSDRAVEETAGEAATYAGRMAETYYCSSNGGASEAPENVWGNPLPYLVGKADPFEALTHIPDYRYTLQYSFRQLTSMLQAKGYSTGPVTSAYVSETTPTGNVAEVTFRDSSGRTVKLSKEACRWTLQTKSMRFTITGGEGGGWLVNGAAAPFASTAGQYALTGRGGATLLPQGDVCVITSSGLSTLPAGGTPSGGGDGVTITGTGWGHGVGMSQYGAKAMAEQGKTYREILDFYFTGITLERIK